MLLYNATIYTLDAEKPKVDALAVLNGHILAAGSREEAAASLPRGSKSIDLGGATVLPGLTDAHLAKLCPHPATRELRNRKPGGMPAPRPGGGSKSPTRRVDSRSRLEPERLGGRIWQRRPA